MTHKIISLIFFLTISFILKAQTDYRKAYIVNNSNDTIYGEIDYQSELELGSACWFKEKDKEAVKLYPKDIKEFRFIDSKYYVTRNINGKNVFLEYLIKGEINIYFLRDYIGEHYYIEKQNMKFAEIPYEEGYKNIGDKRVFYRTKRHIGLLNYYMNDAPQILPQIKRINKPQHKNLIQLAETYNNIICKNNKCIIYERKVSSMKVFPELYGGIVKFKNVDNLIDKYYFQSGVIAHIWMPRTSERIFFKTGVTIYKLNYINNTNSNFYKIPIQVEYIYNRGILRPRLSYGLNFYFPSYQSVSFNGGIDIKINETFYLSINSDAEFKPANFMIFPNKFLSYSLNLGLLIRI